jgi:hypothetical protein
MYSSTLFLNLGTRRGWGGQRHAPAAIYPRERLILQEAGWAPGPVWTGTENVAPPGFDPRTVQPVAIRYTDWATRPTKIPLTPSVIEPATFRFIAQSLNQLRHPIDKRKLQLN